MGMVDTQLIHGDCLEVMQGMEPNSIHSIVTDPPYGLVFMGANWDRGVPGVAFWEAALRVAKPGAMLLAFGGSRTFHRLTVAIEDAGWEIRDCLMWLYGSGFPKSASISKLLDKAAGAEREVIGANPNYRETVGEWRANEGRPDSQHPKSPYITAPATDAARQWDGWGTALKPAYEPIIMAMKPLDGTYANNALVHGVAGINVDASRIHANGESLARPFGYGGISAAQLNAIPKGTVTGEGLQGRWPANLLLDEEAAAMLDEMSGPHRVANHGPGIKARGMFGVEAGHPGYNDTATNVSRFFYVAKASKRDRDEGLEGMEERKVETMNGYVHPSEGRTADKNGGPKANFHPCVKPTKLMQWLVRLVTPPGGTVLDPFCGSGSTGKAAVLEGFNFIGIDTEAEYLAIAERRIAHALATAEKPTQTQPALLEVA